MKASVARLGATSACLTRQLGRHRAPNAQAGSNPSRHALPRRDMSDVPISRAQLQCLICGRRPFSRTTLRRHQLSIHGGDSSHATPRSRPAPHHGGHPVNPVPARGADDPSSDVGLPAALRLRMMATGTLLLSSRPPQTRCRPGHKVASECASPESATERLQRSTRLLLPVSVLFMRPSATRGGGPGWCDGGHATRLDSLTPVGCAPSSQSFSAQVGVACPAETSTNCGTCSSSGRLMRKQEKGGPRD